MTTVLAPYWLLLLTRRSLFGLPVLFLYLSDKGIDDLSIAWCLATLAACQIVFEVPSGIASDRLGRRNTLVIAGVLRTVGWMLFSIVPNLSGCLVGFACLGAAFAFDSGTDAAWLYDTLKERSAAEQYQKLESRAHLLGLVALAGATLVGGWVSHAGIDVAIQCTVVPMVMSIAAAVMLAEPAFHKPASDREFLTQVRAGLKSIWKERLLFQVVLLAAIIIAACEVYFRFVQQFVVSALSVEPTHLGYIYCAWLGVSALGARAVALLTARHRVVVILRYAVIMLGVSLVWLGGGSTMACLLLTVVPQLCVGVVPVLVKTELNASLDSSVRATTLSCLGFMTSCFVVAAAPLIGFGISVFGEGVGLVLLGVLILTSAVGAHVLGMARRLDRQTTWRASLWG